MCIDLSQFQTLLKDSLNTQVYYYTKKITISERVSRGCNMQLWYPGSALQVLLSWLLLAVKRQALQNTGWVNWSHYFEILSFFFKYSYFWEIKLFSDAISFFWDPKSFWDVILFWDILFFWDTCHISEKLSYFHTPSHYFEILNHFKIPFCYFKILNHFYVIILRYTKYLKISR